MLAADKRQHALDQNVDLQQRLKGEISDISELLAKQRERRFKTELGEVEPLKPAAPVQHRAWEIDQEVLKAGLPEYPAILRGSEADDGEVFPAALEAMQAFYQAALADHFRRHDCHPDELVRLDLHVGLMADMHAQLAWLSERCGALEACVKELQERPVAQYRGVWANEETYKRGDMTTFGGSTWHCELDSSRGVRPGDGIGWRLMVKKGRDGRDAR
ncbi:hypothetical protein EOA27_23850 [Mesorhizobium sp. M2A.F.Ca.ET.037.01.1.1]|uniref:hypothetical protein n=1 Tax=unclassified Mesorhizobium TaxID=325217 RepID=UPI000FCC0366|nr:MULTISPECIES: hypothetical protein [unclassified Mesorhizobium]RUX09927.1 hypothetical protein EOA27_23850 [Mesorhizobium sp. M2A.F.Ca.ET.037.01.1.1]RWX63049.1 hypothetical protein EOA24_26315 [Mesorhizobium sp. M2A.F.Ca.ET.039.01.1.1]TIV33578.1 MAG: hypothetical protein E5V99_11895 [Mesorhizobium sp.]